MPVKDESDEEYVQQQMIREANIVTLGREIFKIYAERKARGQGVPYKRSARHDQKTYFEQAAAIALDFELNADHFIAAMWEGAGMVTGPFPTMIGGLKARQWAQRYKERMGQRPQESANTAQVAGTDLRTTSSKFHELKDILDHAYHAVQLACGETGLHGDRAQDLLCDPAFGVHPLIKVLFAYPDPRLRFYTAERVLEMLQTEPAWVSAARQHQFPIDEIHAWLLTK